MGFFRALKAAMTGQRTSDVSGGAKARGDIEAGDDTDPARAVPSLVIPRSVLFVESAPAARESLDACLAGLAPAFSGRVLTSGAEGLEELARGKYDAVAPAFQLSDM